MNDTVEKYVADTVLQEPLKVNLNGKAYTVSRPSAATIIEVSKYIATLPLAPFIEGKHEVLTYVLAYAKDCEAIGHIAATLILGKKNIITTKEVVTKRFFGLYKKVETVEVDNRSRLAKELLEECTNEELLSLITNTLEMQHIAFFFRIIISLNEANILRKTKEKAN
jgi:hypothetical protein